MEHSFKKISLAQMVAVKLPDDDFGKVLVRYMDEDSVSIKSLSLITGIKETAISEYRHNKHMPGIKAIIKISIALHLSKDKSIYLLRLSGNALDNTYVHNFYDNILGCILFEPERTIDDYNDLLRFNGIAEKDLL